MFTVKATTINRVVYTDATGRTVSAEPGTQITLDAVQANDLELAGALIVAKEEVAATEAKEDDKSTKKAR